MNGFDVGLILAIASSAAAVLGWYRAVTRNQYAREREYSHIVRSLEQQTLAANELLKELDHLGDRISRLEILMLRSVCDVSAV